MKAFLDWLKSLFKMPIEAPSLENVSPVKLEPKELPWMEIAKRELGQREIAGDKDNPRIVEYHATTRLKAAEDEIPWCSSFVNWVFTQLKWERTNSAGASSWTKWGTKLLNPRYGCVVVKSRVGGNHVCFFVRAESRDGVAGFIGLGGNQGNKVCEAWYPLSSVKAYRWPKEYSNG
jgi:uncharacterized protein (TIGR02594 family)